MVRALIGVLVPVISLAPVRARAQATSGAKTAEEEHPLIVSMQLNGVRHVEADELLATLANQPTTCKAFILKLFCALTHSHLFEDRHNLDRAELPRDELRIKVYYWLRGYRHTQVSTAVTPKGEGVGVAFDVTEGPPTMITSVTVRQTPPLLSARRVRRSGLPREGQPLDLTQVDSLRTRVRRTLWDRGYGNAVVSDTALAADSLHVALDILIDAGPRTTIDTVIVAGNRQVMSRTIHRLVGLGHGDLYRRSDLLAAQRRLYRSELFRTALITVPDSADSAKRVLVRVREAPPRAVKLGVGLNTVEFAQAQANLTLYNWLGSARRVELQSAVANLGASTLYGKPGFGAAAPTGVDGRVSSAFLRPTWQLSASMTQPWLFSTMNSLGLSVFSSRRIVPGVVIDRGTGGSATFTHLVQSGLPVSLSYRYERARVDAGELYFCVDFGYCGIPTIHALQATNTISPLVLGAKADRTDDPLEPTSGYTASLSGEYASAFTGSDWRYRRIEGEAATYFRVGHGVLVLHADAGRVASLGGGLNGVDPDSVLFGLIHPRERFYGGGARSVRGYAEGQLGPRVLTVDPAKLTGCTDVTIAAGTCDPNATPARDFIPRPVGADALLVGTIEYRRNLSKALGGAIFVDAGRVGGGNLPPDFHARSAITPGVGLRYTSPIGPVRVDLGLRPTGAEALPVVTQVRDTSGQLRLVQLATPKQYDPTAGTHSFLGAITSRLELHLYIGEAY